MAAQPQQHQARSTNENVPHQQQQPQPPTPPPSPQLQFLQSQGFPSGMIRDLSSQQKQHPVRIWIIDNSIFMNVRDAHVLRGNYQNTDATRWEELQDCVAYHADFAARFALPIRFALLNQPTTASLPQYFGLMQSSGNVAQEQATLHRVMTHTQPNGPTPLTKQLLLLRDYIVSMAPQLRAQNQKVPIIVATQGLPTDDASQSSPQVLREFIAALRSFERLPVWIVMRMCTDDEKAFHFYNSLDADQLVNLPIDVLDDFYGEALEVYLHNPWLTYGIVLHRYREMGFSNVPVLDLLDEQALTKPQLRDLCHFLFVGNNNNNNNQAAVFLLPDPTVDWNGFLQTIQRCMALERPHFNSVTKTVTPWINLAQLDAIYGRVVPTMAPAASTTPSFGAPTPHAAPAAATAAPPPSATTTTTAPTAPPRRPIQDTTQLKQAIETQWAKQPPSFMTTRPLTQLLTTMSEGTFWMVPPHDYFQNKFHPFAKSSLLSSTNQDEEVLKRAVRKVRFFLHPDRLPQDFNTHQTLLCKTLWDVIAEVWEQHQEKQQTAT